MAAQIVSINPTTGEVLRRFDPLKPGEIEARLDRAVRAFRDYRRASFAERGGWLARAGDILEAEQEAFARLMTTEMGKPIRAAGDEVLKCARTCRYFAQHAERFLADQPVTTDDGLESVVRYRPLGVVLGVMPWNFPFWQVVRFAAPTLMAGNTVLIKHASNVPQCALALEEIFRRAGFPPGVFQVLLIGADQVGPLLDDPRVAAASVTGSTGAGSAVAGRAGAAVKKTVLELGGSDPFIVMPSADLDEAVRTAVQARVINNGQSCIAAKRFIVAEAVAGPFETRFVDAMTALRVGDPLDPATEVGPLATAAIRDTVDDQVQRSVKAGAALRTGGRRLDRPGFFYEPTVLASIPPEAPALREEVFGPVAALVRVPDLEAAIRAANDTPFGLGASIWTNDPREQARFTDEVEAGVIFFNAMVASDPRLPFGGVKQSGYGRELGEHGAREFVNVLTVRRRVTAGAGRPASTAE
ncbi:MAG TPA: NAD-dependent succinate-semialdehyde dehydrogenase [Candidatus Binatia bacterium]|nr:NAD-dependent succinate-semialdehyde dehydrogenase [Candidatus Binatia bacterium]